MKASGGVAVNTSSEARAQDLGANVSHVASRSRWRCTQPFGSPVVPEVKAMIATSSAPVGTASKPSAGGNDSRPYSRTARSTAPPPPRADLARDRASTSACETCALAITFVSSPARRSGIVATTMPPASRIPNQPAISSGEFGPCRRTRLPGHEPLSSTSAAATADARARSSA